MLGQRAPVAVAEALDVGDEDLVLLRRPRALLEARLLAAGSPPHCGRSIFLLCLFVALRGGQAEGGRVRSLVSGDGSTGSSGPAAGHGYLCSAP